MTAVIANYSKTMIKDVLHKQLSQHTFLGAHSPKDLCTFDLQRRETFLWVSKIS